MQFLAQIEAFLNNAQNFLIAYWPFFVIAGILYVFIFETSSVWWHFYHHKKVHDYMHHQKHVFLQIRFPKENLKTPKAMEQVIASLHGTHSFVYGWRDIYLKGKVDDWFSLEMVGRSNGISFYAQVQSENRKMFEAAFFAQYPEVEIMEVEDYLHDLPEELPDETYDIFGTEYVLSSKAGDAMPIKTYQFFESPSDDQRLDPMSTIAEVASNLKEDETILIQLLIRSASTATHPDIEESRKNIIGKIMQRAEKEEHHGPGIFGILGNFVKNVALAPFKAPEWGSHDEEKQEMMRFVVTTPIEQEIVKAVENKMAKNLFETIFRFIYIDRRDAFTASNPNAVFGAVTQFSERNMNSFTIGAGSFTVPHKLKYISGSRKHFAKKRRLENRKKKLFEAYKERSFPAGPPLVEGDYVPQSSILSAEELATIFHPPGAPVGAQRLAPIEMKKAGPPSSLPIVD